MEIGSRDFRLDFPIRRVHCGMPMANGDLGVLIIGEGRRLEIVLCLASCWDHRNSQRFEKPCPYDELIAAWTPEDASPVSRRLIEASTPLNDFGGVFWRGTRVPGGRFVLHLEADLKHVRLAYGTGMVAIVTTAGEVHLGLTPGHNRLYVLDPCRLVASTTAEPMWSRLSALFESVGYQPPTDKSSPGQVGWFQPCPEDPGTLAILRQTNYGFCLAAERSSGGDEQSLDGWEDWPAAQQSIASWWADFWRRQPTFTVPETFWNDFFLLALYKFGCATMPGGWAASLQGPWLEDYQRPPWSCDYHFNVNIQLIYTLAFATGNFQHALPLFDMLEQEEFQATMRGNAKALFGIDDGLLLPHAVDDRGWQVGGMGAGATLDFVCGGWTAMLYWNYYRYSGDREFLRCRAMPFMRGVMRVYQSALREHEGRLSLPVSISAEYGCSFKVRHHGRLVNQNTGRDPSYQLACMHVLANALLEGSELLGEKPDPFWQELKERLPHFTFIGEGTERRVAIWEGQDLDVCHRHHSHLAMVYPFDLSGELNEEEQAAVSAAIDLWILRGMGQWSEWCYPWAIQIQARRGFQDSPILLFRLWKEIFLNESLATAYLPRFQGLTAHRKDDMLKPKETHEVMQLDGTMAAATALLDLLIHERAGVAHLFAAIPETWSEAEFRDVVFPGAFRISARRAGGKTVFCQVEAPQGGTLRICLAPGAEIRTVTMKPGEQLRLA
ncbi:MAG: hypothetical protein BWX73_01656 [Lentisphaerae bacterium ADurb.Bin082]|nr:MAG: hypothetical protein BWX73_01656 [Lentisphaerae bacterium ADurb.Bin082]